MEVGFCTDKGKHRSINQDNYYVQTKGPYPYFVVADGMGGKNAGEIASQEAIRYIVSYVEAQLKNFPLDDPYGWMEEVFLQANGFVHQLSTENQKYEGMGTTLVFAIQMKDILYIGNVGDSRLYAIGGKEVLQLTKDHSVVASLVEKGEISEKEAINHPQKNIITRALGVDTQVQADIFQHLISGEDIFMMCTDGLSNRVKKEDIIEIMSQTIGLQKKAEQLIEFANQVDGTDNSTVILFQLDKETRGDRA